jgi:hypothetical protein
VRPRIVWTPPAPAAVAARGRLKAFAPDLLAPPSAARANLRAALAFAGLPAVEGAASPRDDAVGLLMLAAEVEHALMVQYLYAAYSVRGVANLTIAHIAIQEMGHLLTVQNLLLALTGVTAEDLPAGLHLGRDGLRRASTLNPLPLVLEPVSHEALAKFVVVERPAEIADPTLAARVSALEAEVAALGVHPNPVHALYAAILWIFSPDDADDPSGPAVGLGFKPGWHLLDSDFVDASVIGRFSAEPGEWGSIAGLIVQPVAGRDDALAALRAITAQGEGAPGAMQSHFQDFLRILDAFEAGQVHVAALARTPYTTNQPPPEDARPTLVTEPYTALWADLFSAAYELQLLDLAWALSQPRGGPRRSPLIDLCVDAMRTHILRPIARNLAGRPVAAAGAALAGAPFGLGHDDTPTTVAGFAARYATLIGARDAVVQRIVAAAEFPGDAAAAPLLAAMAEIDARRAPHLPGAP